MSLKSIKRMLLREMTYRDGIDYGDLNAEVREVAASADAREGITARLEKRKSNFQGK